MRVLLVDDEPGIAGALSAFLRLHGMDVQEAYNYETASRLLDQGGWSILISDHNLPDGTGFELCKRFCAQDKGIALLLSAGSHAVFEEIEEREGFYFLPKPVVPGKLLSWIQEKKEFFDLNRPAEAIDLPRSEDPFRDASLELQRLGLSSVEVDHCLCALFPSLLFGELKKIEVGEEEVAFELKLGAKEPGLPREAVENPFPGSDLWLVRDRSGVPRGVQVRVFRRAAVGLERGKEKNCFRVDSFRDWSSLLQEMDRVEKGSRAWYPSWLLFGVEVLRHDRVSGKDKGDFPSLSRMLWTSLDGLGGVES